MSYPKPQQESIIKIERLFVRYGRSEILHDVSMEIPKGLFLPFMGPNGAGKTTLLRTILGLIRPSAGKVLKTFHPSDLGYVPQQRSIDNLYPVTAGQIVMMGLYPELGPWRRPNREQKERLNRLMEELGLNGHAGKAFGELSGGMKQKVLIARALVAEPEVLVMDEPTSELDEQSERDVLHKLSTLCEKRGKTVLLAHHGLDMKAAPTSTVCRVDHGSVRLVQSKNEPEPDGRGGNP
ncbi:MAG: ATP-binding cassette domain-containing protein [Deltaproteobacteria bacterium]|jgi:ABC-type Mn2+/Zn2+ transport system ATPase subunit|nr:ATP-binding cassette domain-containing protein [Deltaproteobacteria bacterium]